MKINLALADDHPALLSGLESRFAAESDFQVIGTARNSSELIGLLERQHCEVLVCDYCMPGGVYGDGLLMLSFIRRHFPNVHIIVFTMIDNTAIRNNILKLGIKAVFSKSIDMCILYQAIREIHATDVHQPVQHDDTEYHPQHRDMFSLSRCELEVLRLYANGDSISQIAVVLNRTKQTVSTQKSSAMQKLGLQHDLDLYRFAYQAGVIQGSCAAAEKQAEHTALSMK